MSAGRVPGRPGGSGGAGATIAAGSLAGRGAASGAGVYEQITLGTNLTMSGTTLNANAGSGAPSGASYVVIALDAGLSAERRLQIEAAVLSLTDGGANGDVTIGVAANGITNAKLRQSVARALVGNATNATANVADIAGGGAGTVFQDTGTALVAQALTRILQNLSLEGDVTPAQLAANTDNWNPTGFGTASVVRFSTDADGREIRGMVPATNDGDIKFLVNVGSFTGVLKNEQGTSGATNRFVTADVTVGAGEVALCYHDPNENGGVGRWRVLLKLLTLGTAAHQACAGNDPRLSDSRAPNGSAGGSLTGTYPNPTIAAGAVGGTEIAAAIKDPAAGTAGLRTLSNTSTSACAGNDSRLSDTRTPTDGSVTEAKFATVVGNAVFTLTDAATIAINRDNGKNQQVTITATGRALGIPSGTLVNGMFLIIAIRKTNAGDTVTLATGTGGWRATSACSLTPTIHSGTTGLSYIVGRYDSTDNKWDAVALTTAA